LLAQSIGDLLDFARVWARGEDGGLRRQVVGDRALGVQLLGDFQLLASFRMRAVEDRPDLLEVLR